MSRRFLAVSLASYLIIALAGCDGGSDEGETTAVMTTTGQREPQGQQPPRETRDPLPDRPPDSKRFANERGGYALFLPRGWNPKPDGPQTLVRSYDQLVAFTIAADRSPEGLETDLEDYATTTADELRGFRGGFAAEGMRPREHRYEGVVVHGPGRSRDGVDQRVSVIVLRRRDLATLTVVLAASARPAARESARLARRSIATLRTRPPLANRSSSRSNGEREAG